MILDRTESRASLFKQRLSGTLANVRARIQIPITQVNVRWAREPAWVTQLRGERGTGSPE